MRIPALLALTILTGGLLATAGEDDAAAKEREKFQGTWTIVSIEVGGKKSKDPVDAATVVFQGTKYVIKAGDEVVEEGTFEIDPSKAPKWIAVTATAGAEKGKKYHGIYEIKGDTLRAAVAPTDKDRPTKLDPAPGTRTFTVKRQKSAGR